MTTQGRAAAPMSEQDLHAARAAAAPLLDWLREAAWPVWLAQGVDWTRRAFHETLDPATFASASSFRRLRVAARQVFVFAEAHRMGVPRAAEAVELGIEFLLRAGRGEDGGFAGRFDLEGRVIDPVRDLYDHAFVLLAFASAAGVLPREAMRRHALELLGYLDARFAHPLGGYVESLPPALPRRQNPHMHLLEACLAAAEATGEEVFLRRADTLAGLMLDRMLDAATGSQPEYFDEALLPLREAGRHMVEPGHHCEWVWLLDWHRAVGTADQARSEAGAARLLAFVDRFGANPGTGTLRDEVWSDGQVKSGGSRLWPQTEWIKAQVLRPDATAKGILAATAALERYLLPAPRGLWLDRLSAAGEATAEPAPASSLYHLTAGILCLHRALRPGEQAR